MKFLLSLFFAAITTNAVADTLVVNPSSKTSPATLIATAYKDAVGTTATWYQAETCQDAVTMFNKTPGSILAYNSSMDFAGREKGLNCQLGEVNAAQVIFVGKEYFDICTALTNTKPYDGTEKITLGVASMYATKRNQADQRASGVNVTIVPYAGSKDIVNAVINGDINYGWIGHSVALKTGKSLNCQYSTNPEEKNYIGNTKKLELPNFHINLVVYTNSSDPKLIADLRKAAQSNQFKTFINESSIDGIYNPTQKDVDNVNKYVERMYNAWGTKN